MSPDDINTQARPFDDVRAVIREHGARDFMLAAFDSLPPDAQARIQAQFTEKPIIRRMRIIRKRKS